MGQPVVEPGVHVTVQVPAGEFGRALEVLSGAGFQVTEARENWMGSRARKALVRAVLPGDGAPDQQREVIAATEQALAAIGIESSWGSTGVGAGSISSEWVEVVDAVSRQPLGIKVCVANRFEVDQELTRAAVQIGRSRALLDVTPRPRWLGTEPSEAAAPASEPNRLPSARQAPPPGRR